MLFLSLVYKGNGGTNNKFYTVTELAKELGVSRPTVYSWLQAGRFSNSFEVGEGDGAITLIPLSDVEIVRKEEADKLLKKLNRLGFQAVPA